ncbi:hypothetical protein ANCDUO_06167 [Ancylostoma duodenale]|uniref:Uncharacterized protein n=1 Tax=Ancylostoma duodenale TaxID=51022 RepID=A0A0C2GWT0_9BILA|nr:hypothetical protein ANCDUO_06167 [Ancylostoma duodenale]
MLSLPRRIYQDTVRRVEEPGNIEDGKGRGRPTTATDSKIARSKSEEIHAQDGERSRIGRSSIRETVREKLDLYSLRLQKPMLQLT